MTVLTAERDVQLRRGQDAPALVVRRPANRLPLDEPAEVGVDELIFSATNRRGIITGANAVFTRISGHDRGRLLGAPHNLIRHPEMPGGAFRTIWSQLAADCAATGYVQNLTADGREYWTFAVFSPGEGGHLSIRQRPCSPILPAVIELYERARRQERAVRVGGGSAVEAAQAGEQCLVEGVRKLGFGGYHEFVLETLPAEVAIRAALGGGLAWQARGQQHTAARAALVENRVRALALNLYTNRSDDTELVRLIEQTTAATNALGAALGRYTSAVGELATGAPAVAAVAGGLGRDLQQVWTLLVRLIEDAQELRDARYRLRCGAALAQLQAETVGRLVQGVADGAESPHACGHAVERLTDALHGQLADISAEMQHVTDLRAGHDALAEALVRAEQNLDSWRLLTGGQQSGTDEQDLGLTLATVRVQHRSLRALSGRLALAMGGFDPREVGQDVLDVDARLRREVG